MSVNIKKAAGYISSLRKSREEYLKKVPGRLAKIYSGKDKNPKPDYFRESSFLYIRSYNGDVGVRPFSGINFWNSPDITINPISNAGMNTTELYAGNTYNIRCRLNNRGDLMIPFPKVELFLTNPSLGFNTTVGELLGLTQLQGLLLPASNGEAQFTYTVPASEAGHKCLFARTYSFSPLDKPFDLHALDPRLDRHIGQKNLNIISQGSTYSFNLVHQPNAIETIEFRPMTVRHVTNLQHPALQKVKITALKDNKALAQIKLEVVAKTPHKINLTNEKGLWQIRTSGKGISVEKQGEIIKSTNAILKAIHSGKGSHQHFRKELKPFRELNRHVAVTSLQITIPDFGTRKGYAVGLEIINKNKVDGTVKGGITVIATGN
ncbi:hypothetical protein KCTC52924_03245 [Arenibacter antarcticus]|uniref:CARDB domain-containing protein n=1 Tax=Arenibacter antarcticus TaxID=2040469 RepID=A0ABW5VJ81_9FLAO|nr:hypothetical protein [Arenibacter sp. H213]MCM4166316.1 hypothetical protein [Arenibacter sp. H213]